MVTTMLDEVIFQSSLRELAVRDSDLARVVETYGAPPLWVREPGFPSLVYIILEQQVSLASARAAFQRLRVTANPLTPRRFLTLSDRQLKEIGFSRQKTLYIRLLAESLVKKYLDLNDLHDLSDDAARKYSAFGIATGIRLGYIALAVGWLVGMAIKKGSNGIGGRRYQIAAVALTYAAVSLSAIPVGIYYLLKEKNPVQISHAPSSSSAPNATEPGSASPQDDSPASGQRSTPSLTSATGALLFAGLASPFLELAEGVSGLIGLVIIFVGIRIAWKMTGAPRLDILGPFQGNAPPSPAPNI